MIFVVLLSLALTNAEMYCPSDGDWTIRYGDHVQVSGNGWTISGNGGVNGNAAFNMLGGYVQYDVDTSGAQGGVNNNFYTVSPESWLFPGYCDIQPNGSPQCMEMDIMENNGNCLTATTWHTWPNYDGGCDCNGCVGTAYASNRRTMKAEFSGDGWMVTTIDGNRVEVNNPTPSDSAKNYVAQQSRAIGLQFQSSQWTGWVPDGNCPGGGWLDGSTFTISNVVVSGTVVQGSEPRRCMDLEEPYRSKTMASIRKYKLLQETFAEQNRIPASFYNATSHPFAFSGKMKL